MKSIVQGERQGCYICGRTPTECHHIFGGVGNRDLSDDYGLTVDLCAFHHRDHKDGVHFNPVLMNTIKKKGREAFEREYPELDFETIFIRGK